MKIIFRFVEENKVLDFSKLFNSCLRETELDSSTLFNMIDRLEKENRIKFGHRIIRDFVLVNMTRKSIYTFIKVHPGTRYVDLQKSLALNNSVLNWNLSILLKFNCIHEVLFNNLRIFGVKEFDNDQIILQYLMRNEKVKRILFMLVERKMLLTELVDRSGFNYQDIYYLTNQLLKNNILLNELDGTKKVFAIHNHFLSAIQHHFLKN